jgi:CRP-like cAMP-binding protein
MDVGKQELRSRLTETGRRIGLSGSTVDDLVRQAQVGRWRKNHHIFDADDTTDLVNFLVSGAVKVTCPTGDGTVCVQMIKPGQFFGLNWYPEPGQQRVFVATAFTDSVVAMVTSERMARVVADAPPAAVLRLFTYSWRALSGLLYEKCCLLGLGLRDRLLHELGVLARDFGRPRGYGDGGGDVVIDLPLTHADLAEFAIASRANVARAMKRLEHDGLVDRDGRRVVLTGRFFSAGQKHVHRLVRNGLATLPTKCAV